MVEKVGELVEELGGGTEEVERMNEVGALLKPKKLGLWLMLGEGSPSSEEQVMEGGWLFPEVLPLSSCLLCVDVGDPLSTLRNWAKDFNIHYSSFLSRGNSSPPLLIFYFFFAI